MTNRRLYNTPLPIGPNRHPKDQIHDAEAFCRRYLNDAFDNWGMYLRQEDYDDSLSLLITQLWQLAQTFNPERNDCFANYARSIIPKRAADVGPRRLLGRNGNRLPDHLHEPLNPEQHQPREPQPTEPSSQNPDRGQDDRGLQQKRNSQRAWAATILDLRTTPKAA